MPLLRYFLFVGGSLLALLLVANAALPSAPVPEGLTSATDLPPVRIHSERKLPERIVFDTSVAMPARAPAAPVVIAQTKPQAPAAAAAPQVKAETSKVDLSKPDTSEISAKVRVREAFAQLPPEEDSFEPKMSDMATVVVPEPKMYPARQPVKKVAAKPRTARPMMMVAQQPRPFGTW
jgi:hypothetical protein